MPHLKRKMGAIGRVGVFVLLLIMCGYFLNEEFGSDTYSLHSFVGILILSALLATTGLAWSFKSVLPCLIIMIANPITLNFGRGLAEWYKPHPRFLGRGYPSPDASNLDPDTRCYFAFG